MRFVLDGEMPEYLLAKDLILQVRRRAVDALFHQALCMLGAIRLCCLLLSSVVALNGLRHQACWCY
jgi:hypothetical protein